MSDGEKATAQKLFENEERLGALTDKWKDRWKEMQNIMQVGLLPFTISCLFSSIQPDRTQLLEFAWRTL